MTEKYSLCYIRYRILPNTRTSPNRRAPPKFSNHIVPEVSRPDLLVNAVKQFVKRCVNDLFVASHEIIQMDTKTALFHSLKQLQAQNQK